MKTRLTGGLAAAALLTAGLACQGGAASAADVSGYPATLDFAPQKVVADDDAVYAAGVSDDYSAAYVTEVGGPTVTLDTGEGSVYSVDLAADADSLLAVVSTENGTEAFSVDPATMDAEPVELPATWSNVDLLGSDAVGAFEVVRDPSQTVLLAATGITAAALDDQGSASAAAATGTAGHRSWFVGGTHFTGESTGRATLWSYDEATTESGPAVVLGPQGDPDESVIDVAADEADDTVYALSFQNQDDAPQTYGLSVVHDGDVTYYPLDGPAGRLALSADGHTLFVSIMGNLLALDTDRLVDHPDSADDVRSTYLEAGSVTDLATDPTGHLFAAAGHDVAAFSAPGAPATVSFAGEPDFPEYGTLSWTAPTATGGTSGDSLAYAVRLTDRAGGEPRVKRVYGTEQGFEDLTPGHTYDVSISTDNGLFLSAPATTSFTVAAAQVAHPDAVDVDGSGKVGSRLTASFQGAWAAGTRLTYRWTANGAAVSTASTLTLTPAMLGKRVAVAVTGTHAGAAPVTVTSDTVTVTRGTLAAAKPRITGKATVGKTLTAVPGAWTKGTALTYTWSANGKKIAGATKKTLKLTKALKGKKVTVAVTGKLAGYTTRTMVSAPTAKVAR